MPGFTGIVCADAAITDAPALLERIDAVNALPHAPMITRRVVCERALIVNMLTGLWANVNDQPAIDPARSTYLLLEGQLFNWDDIASEVARDHNVAWAQSPCEQLLALFLREGSDFVKQLDGEFNLAIYQPARHRLLLYTDRLASKPFYYLAQRDALLFGSEKKGMLALADPLPELDPVGLLQFVAYRHHAGGRTLHQGVRALPPAAMLEYRDHQVRLTRYANLRFQLRALPRDLTPLLDEWGARLCAATQRRMDAAGTVLLSLSGGLDSRAVACALQRTQPPVLARTLGETGSAEVKAACAIARRFGFKHRLEAPGSVPLSTLLPQVVWRTDGAVPFIHGMTLAQHGQLKQQADFMAGGWLGDASSGAHLATFMLFPHTRTRFINKVHDWYTRYHLSALQQLFQPEFLRAHWPELVSVFHESFAPLAAGDNWEENWQAFELWDLQERQTRMTFSAGPTDSHLFELIRPFLDPHYLDFALSLPPYLRYGQAFYQAMIYQLSPEIRHIANANTGLPLQGTVRGNLLNRVIARKNRAAARVRERLAPRGRTSLTNRRGLDEEIRQDPALRHTLDAFLTSDFFDTSIFRRTSIEAMLDEHAQGLRDHAYPITMLATMAVALPTFVYQRPQAQPALPDNHRQMA